jgi:hypothetical protein
MKHQKEEPKPIANERPDAPRELVAICSKLMAKSPSQRYQTADEASQALAGWLASYRSSQSTSGRFAPPSRPNPPAQTSAPRPKSNGDDEEFRFAPLEEEQGRSARPGASPSSARAASESGASASQTQTGAGASGTKVGASSIAGKTSTSGLGAKGQPGQSGGEIGLACDPSASKTAASKPQFPENKTAASSSKLGASQSNLAASQSKLGAAAGQSSASGSKVNPAAAKPAAPARQIPTAQTPGATKPAPPSDAQAPGGNSAIANGAASSPASQPAAAKSSGPNRAAPHAATKPAPAVENQVGDTLQAPSIEAALMEAAAPLLSAPLDDLLAMASLPTTEAALQPLGASSALGAPKKPAAKRGPSYWDSTWFLIGFGTLLALLLIGAVALYRWLFV